MPSEGGIKRTEKVQQNQKFINENIAKDSKEARFRDLNIYV